MRVLKVLCAGAALAATLSTGSVAQSTAPMFQPAELPPAGFAGRYYVDSRGCLFVRTGSVSNVLWVPRIDRGKQLVCGYAPNQNLGGTVASSTAPMAASGGAVHMTTKSMNAATGVALPKGYRAAWDDGRLNPSRGPQSAEGDAQMALVWTDTVPMARLGQ